MFKSLDENVKAFSSVLASIYYYFNYNQNQNNSSKDGNCNDNCNVKIKNENDIVNYFNDEIIFWVKNGVFTSNQNRAKMVYDLIKKYIDPNINQNDFNKIRSIQRDLKRPENENKIFYELIKNNYNNKFNN